MKAAQSWVEEVRRVLHHACCLRPLVAPKAPQPLRARQCTALLLLGLKAGAPCCLMRYPPATLPALVGPSHLCGELRLSSTNQVLEHLAGAGNGTLKPVHAVLPGLSVERQQAILTEHLMAARAGGRGVVVVRWRGGGRVMDREWRRKVAEVRADRLLACLLGLADRLPLWKTWGRCHLLVLPRPAATHAPIRAPSTQPRPHCLAPTTLHPAPACQRKRALRPSQRQSGCRC